MAEQVQYTRVPNRWTKKTPQKNKTNTCIVKLLVSAEWDLKQFRMIQETPTKGIGFRSDDQL